MNKKQQGKEIRSVDQKKPINIVLFYLESLSDEALLLTERIIKDSTEQWKLNFRLLRHNEKISKELLDELSGIIFLYTDELKSNENLYEVIHHIEPKADLQRYLILYNPVKSIPNIFHAIRAQQHHMFFQGEESENEKENAKYRDQFIDDFTKNLPEMASYGEKKSLVPASTFWGRLTDAWRNPIFRRSLVVVIVAMLLGYIVWFLLPVLSGSVERREGAYKPNIPVPQMHTCWMDSPFSPFGIESRWNDRNFYKGKSSLSIGTTFQNNTYMFDIYTDQVTKEAIFTRQSISSWPLDEIKGLSTGILLEPLEDEGSTAEITVAMVLSEQTEYRFGCTLLPVESESSLECFINEPGRLMTITAPQTLDINVPHTITIEFQPNTYVLRFFVDDVYFGQAPIPNVAYWRDRKVNTEIVVELRNMQSGTFGCQIQKYQIGRQDQ